MKTIPKILKFFLVCLGASSVMTVTGFAQEDGDVAKAAPLEQPRVRIPPMIPPRANRSGSCVVRFDVSAAGQTKNIRVVKCTESIFARNSRKAVSNFRYKPAPHGRIGVETNIKYRLQGEDGTCPDKNIAKAAVTAHRNGKFEFTPAKAGEAAVTSGPYQTIFWGHKDKFYFGTEDDQEALCRAE